MIFHDQWTAKNMGHHGFRISCGVPWTHSSPSQASKLWKVTPMILKFLLTNSLTSTFGWNEMMKRGERMRAHKHHKQTNIDKQRSKKRYGHEETQPHQSCPSGASTDTFPVEKVFIFVEELSISCPDLTAGLEVAAYALWRSLEVCHVSIWIRSASTLRTLHWQS